MDRLCVQLFLKPITNMRANSLFGGYCALQQIINCSAISLAVWNPELKKLYDRNVAISYQTLLSVNFREGLGTRLIVRTTFRSGSVVCLHPLVVIAIGAPTLVVINFVQLYKRPVSSVLHAALQV